MPGQKKIKVLHIITRLILGGAQQNTLITVKNLEVLDKDYSISLISGPETGAEGSLVEEAKTTKNFIIIPELVRNINIRKDIISFIKIYRIIKNGNFDIVHTHSSKAGILGRWAAKLAGVRIVVHTVHGWGFNPFQNALIRSFYILLEKLTINATTKMIAVSNSTISKGLKNNIGKRNIYSLIYSGIELARFKRANNRALLLKEFSIPENTILIGTVTRLSNQKAPLDLVKCCFEINKEKPDVNFLVIGDGPLKKEVIDLAEELGIKDKMFFTGLRKDINNLLELLDIFILSSRWEGLPRVILQAMAKQLPIVATNVDGNSEAITNNLNGILVPVTDYKALAEKAVFLLNNPEIAEKMGQANLNIIEKFSAKKMLIDIDKLYKELLKCKG